MMRLYTARENKMAQSLHCVLSELLQRCNSQEISLFKLRRTANNILSVCWFIFDAEQVLNPKESVSIPLVLQLMGIPANCAIQSLSIKNDTNGQPTICAFWLKRDMRLKRACRTNEIVMVDQNQEFTEIATKLLSTEWTTMHLNASRISFRCHAPE